MLSHKKTCDLSEKMLAVPSSFVMESTRTLQLLEVTFD